MDAGRYRAAERALWDSVGIEPTEREILLPGMGAPVRMLEVAGEGEPVLFLHGGPNAGSTFAPMAPGLVGRRLVIVDRPGCGLSPPLGNPIDADNLPAFGDRFPVDVLDALEVDRADVIASSFGGYLALRAAAAAPRRFGSMVQLGCPAFVPGFRTPGFMRVFASPLRHLIFRLPPSEKAGSAMLRQIGHGASVAAGRIPEALGPWSRSLSADTDTNVHEGNMIARLAGVVRGFDPRVALTEETLAAVEAPTLLVWGADDPFGDVGVGSHLRDLLPDARLVVLPDGGHLPWFDDPEHVAALAARHLAPAPDTAA